MDRKKILTYFVFLPLIFLSNQVYSAEILYTYVGGTYYHSEGEGIAGFLRDDGHNVTEFDLWTGDLDNDLSLYDQIWVYDLNFYSLDNNSFQVANYNRIANWFDAQSQDLILDGRIISSNYTNSVASITEPNWIQNYASSLDNLNGGLVLGTDHAGSGYTGASVDGINMINDLLDVEGFHDYYFTSPYEAIVDQSSPLYDPLGTHACTFDPTQQCIWDHSSTSYVATGQQVNQDIYLTPVAYHGNISNDFSDAYDFAAVSTTMGSITFGTCGGPNQDPCIQSVPEPSILALMGVGLAGLGFVRRRKVRA